MSLSEQLSSPKPSRKQGCGLCDGPSDVQVSIIARQLGTRGQVEKGSRAASKAISLCVTCADETWVNLLNVFPEREELGDD
jgi:hypothetical protein